MTLHTITIYAASAIDLKTNTNAIGWRKELASCLEGEGVSAVVFDPSQAFHTAMWGTRDLNKSMYIESVNNAALDEAGIFIAFISKGTPSIGVPVELDRAYQDLKEIIVLTDIPSGKSAYLDNRVQPHNHLYFEDLTSMSMIMMAAAKHIKQIISNRKTEIYEEENKSI